MKEYSRKSLSVTELKKKIKELQPQVMCIKNFRRADWEERLRELNILKSNLQGQTQVYRSIPSGIEPVKIITDHSTNSKTQNF